MKKFLIFLLPILFFIYSATYVLAEVVFHNANQVTITWDVVTDDIDGDQVTGVNYILYLVNANTDPDKTNPVVVAETADNTETITLTKGRYYIGVQACLGDLISDINWGDEPMYQDGIELFGLRFAVSPKPPHKLKR